MMQKKGKTEHEQHERQKRDPESFPKCGSIDWPWPVGHGILTSQEALE
jgi:hypothetical protein